MRLAHKYDGLLDLLGERRGEVEKFLRFLEKETNWLIAPASISHHSNFKGGLIHHSVLTTRNLLKLRETLGPDFSVETCITVGLFHDAGKVGAPGQPFYLLEKNRKGQEVFRINEDLVAMGLGVRSLYLCAGALALSDEEAQAICYHDGQYVPDNFTVKNRERPLTLLLHFADMWSSHIQEAILPLPESRSASEK